MKAFKIILILCIVFSLGNFGCKKSEEADPVAPTWTPITGNQFNMIVLGKILRNGSQLSGKGYWLASFGPGGIDSDCRSVSEVEEDGAYYSTIRGNTNGDTIGFMIWDGKKKVSYTMNETVVFKSDDTMTNFQLNYSE